MARLQLKVSVKVFKEFGVFVALCPELNVSSYGENVADAKKSLKEAVKLFTDGCLEMGTLQEVFESAGLVHQDHTWQVRPVVYEDVFDMAI